MAKNISNTFNSRLANTKSIALPQASIDNFNTKEKYEEMITSAFLAQREENEGYTVTHYYKELEDEDYIGKVDIFRLNPEIWDFFISQKSIPSLMRVIPGTSAKWINYCADRDYILVSQHWDLPGFFFLCG